MDARPAKGMTKSKAGGKHPLLGERVEVAGSPGMSVWESEISIEKLPYLADHCVQGSIVVPATAYMEMATAAARELFGDTAIRLSDLSFKRPLVLSAGAAHAVQVSLTPISAESAAIQLFSRPAGGDGAWTLLFTGTLAKNATPAADWNAAGFENFVHAAPRQIGATDFYNYFATQGNQWGPAFRGVTTAWVGHEEAWSRVEDPCLCTCGDGNVLGSSCGCGCRCGHVLSAINAFGGDDLNRRGALVGRGIESVTIWRRPSGTSLLCHARGAADPKEPEHAVRRCVPSSTRRATWYPIFKVRDCVLESTARSRCPPGELALPGGLA